MTRVPNWQTALYEFFEINRERCFKYGEWDCCLMVCDAIEVMTAVDVAESFRGKYSDRPGAYRAMKEFAGKASVRAVAEKITEGNGMPKVSMSMAQRGDVCLIRRGERDFSLGIVGLSGTEIIALQSKGWFQVPLNMAVQCWRV